IEVKSGEKNKITETLDFIFYKLIEMQANRRSVFISLGGGVITDLGGFAAAIFNRGMRHIEVPTTTLGMVDASIGGKNGVNFSDYKNQLGTITKPYFTCCYLPFIKTLDDRNIVNGVAEMIKIALVADRDLWNLMKKKTPMQIAKSESIMTRCIELKEQIVSKDFYDMNERQMLNFGHNFAHAMESYAWSIGFDILHGEAVARGMYYEALLSKNLLGFDDIQYNEITTYLQQYFSLKRTVSQYLKFLTYLQHDKKNLMGDYKFTLLQEIGKAKTNISVTEAEIIKLLVLLQTNI
ncbi:MAG: 3-dehydroquinate synthase, partial [Bacteroidales bacterium]|nr:3-dehydroquinate synthase [Bacteroidales bacterium]